MKIHFSNIVAHVGTINVKMTVAIGKHYISRFPKPVMRS